MYLSHYLEMTVKIGNTVTTSLLVDIFTNIEPSNQTRCQVQYFLQLKVRQLMISCMMIMQYSMYNIYRIRRDDTNLKEKKKDTILQRQAVV